MQKAILVDLDGTLVDTSRINYYSYKYAMNEYGYSLDYDYFKNECNGRHYSTFLPNLVKEDDEILEQIHNIKKALYNKYISEGIVNKDLVEVLKNAKICQADIYKTGLVTTASRKNTYELLEHFELTYLFDVIITQEDVSEKKPNPEGYIKAMSILDVIPENVIVYEDSDIGIEAAINSGATCIKVECFK